VNDAFAPSPAWVKPEEPAPVANVALAAKAEEEARVAARFLQNHKLTAVMDGGKHGVAVVDGKPFRAGQVLDGFALVAVSARTRDMNATFEKNGAQVILHLQEAPATAAVAQLN
jgi:hypothetical protein